tara:strand:- start:2604 stop:2924 length:321 start_codon:yes stop_codon:yes gene_type:complete
MTEDQRHNRLEDHLRLIESRLAEIKILLSLLVVLVLVALFIPTEKMRAAGATVFFCVLACALMYLVAVLVQKWMTSRRGPSADELLSRDLVRDDDSADDPDAPGSP